jgi:hypothetical protein
VYSSLQGRHRRGLREGPCPWHVRPQGTPRFPLSCFTTAANNGANEQGKAKKNAWKAVVDDGLSAEEAQQKYVELIERMKETYGYDENKEPEAVGA